MIEPFYLIVALFPLIAYLMVLGLIRVSGRVLITSGGRDIAALGFAISGLIAVGPGELFFPKAAAGTFGAWVWLALLSFYSLIVCLAGLLSRPRIVVFGRDPAAMLEPLYQAALLIDPQATCDRKLGQVALPSKSIMLRPAGSTQKDSTTIESFRPVLSFEFWDALLGHLRNTTQQSDAPKPRQGFGMLITASVLASWCLWTSFQNQQEILDQFQQWIWRQ